MNNKNFVIKGISGNLLRVNLTTGKILFEEINRDIISKYLLGPGFSSKILWDELKPGIPPLSPDNKLIFSTGLLTGLGIPGSDSIFSIFKSPMTNCIGESRAGGGLGPELKKAGFDVIIIEGKSENPVYLWIHNGKVEIKKANHLWGKTVSDTQITLKNEISEPKAKVICIGPAGEKLVRYSSIMVEHFRAMGRCGGGAVMGSKNLKAIVVRGEQKISIQDNKMLKILISKLAKIELNHPLSGVKSRKDKNLLSFANGTASFMPYYDKIGEIPTKNALSNSWGKGKIIYQNLQNYIVGDEGCLNCILKCGKRSKVKTGRWETDETLGPEYETLACFSNYILNDNVEGIIYINHICNNFGLDTISCGNVIAFAMECYEKGLITKEDTQGIDLTWGNIEAVREIVLKIINRKGIGDILAEGVCKAAKKIGKNSEEFAIHVKGLELPAHDTRTRAYGKAWALQYGTANTGMNHSHPQEPGIVHSIFDDKVFGMKDLVETLKEPYSEIGKGRMVKWSQDFGNIINSLGLCIFHTYLIPGTEIDLYSEIILAATGLKIPFKELMKIGERITNLQRCFNCREGIRRKDDIIPYRLRQIPAFGPYNDQLDIKIENYDAMLEEYYDARGWNKTNGIPSKEKLNELGIEWANYPDKQ